MDLIIDLNFIPVNLDGEPICGETLAKMIARDLCNTRGSEYSLAKYIYAKELYATGKATIKDVESDETKAAIAYFKNFCEQSDYSTEIKGQILLKFI